MSMSAGSSIYTGIKFGLAVVLTPLGCGGGAEDEVEGYVGVYGAARVEGDV